MEYGKKIKVSNFYMLKTSKSLSKAELKVLRNASNIPEDVQKSLRRGSLPYIKVATITDSWSVEFVAGTLMFNVLDALTVLHDADGNYQLYGVEAKNAEATFVAWFADTTTVGDVEYQIAKQKLLSAYLDRASKKANADADADKTEEKIAKENEEALNEVAEKEQASATLKVIHKQIQEMDGEA